MTDSGLGLHSSLSLRSPPKTPKKTLNRAQSMFNCDDLNMEDSIKEKDDRIRELEEIVSRQAEMMNQLKSQINEEPNISIEVDCESIES